MKNEFSQENDRSKMVWNVKWILTSMRRKANGIGRARWENCANLLDYNHIQIISGTIREPTPYHFSCFFIKFINGLWPPPCFIKLRCEIFENFLRLFPLDMIPWYPKQILLHCEEAEKFIFHMPQKTFSMPISCCQSPPEYIKSTT